MEKQAYCRKCTNPSISGALIQQDGRCLKEYYTQKKRIPIKRTQEKINFIKRMVEQMRAGETAIMSNTENKQSSVVIGKKVKYK